MNCEYISQRCLNQRFKCKKLKSHLELEPKVILFSNVPVICEESEQVVFDGGSILHLILWEKNIRLQDAGLKYISYVNSDFPSTSVAFDNYPENLTTTDNTHKCYFNVKTMHF